MLCALNKAIVDAEDKVATLFRGNSLASKGMDQYMKMIAIPYLHTTVGDAIKRLFDDKRSCEVWIPTRHGQQKLTPASAGPDKVDLQGRQP